MLRSLQADREQHNLRLQEFQADKDRVEDQIRRLKEDQTATVSKLEFYKVKA